MSEVPPQHFSNTLYNIMLSYELSKNTDENVKNAGSKILEPCYDWKEFIIALLKLTII